MQKVLRRGWVCVGLLAIGAGARAEDRFEVTLLGGWTAPAVTERTVFESNVAPPDVPGTSFAQEGDYVLSGRGSVAFGGSVAYFFNDTFGIEARLDSINFAVGVEGPVITGTTPLPPPLPALTTTLDLSEGEVNVDRLYPLSFDVKARTGGRLRFAGSAGVSFLPKFSFTAVQRETFGVGSSLTGNLPLATVAVSAEAAADIPASKRFGFNGGAGLEASLSERVSFVAEARVFSFPKQSLAWRNATVAGTRLEEELQEELRTELGVLELDLKYFQVSGGLAIRF